MCMRTAPRETLCLGCAGRVTPTPSSSIAAGRVACDARTERRGGTAYGPVSEIFLAFGRAQNSEHLTILGHCPARDYDLLLGQQLDQFLVAVGPAVVLGFDQFLDRLFHALGGDVFVRGTLDRAVEEELELEQPARRRHVLI